MATRQLRQGVLGTKNSRETRGRWLRDPVFQWTPSMAPSSLMIYSGKKFWQYKDHFFVGGLAITYVSILKLKDQKVVNESKLAAEMGERIRQIKEDPSTGDIYFSTDSGKIFRFK